MSLSNRFKAPDWENLRSSAADNVGRPWGSVSAVKAGLSTANKEFAYMDLPIDPVGTPQAAGAENRGSGKTFGVATPISGK